MTITLQNNQLRLIVNPAVGGAIVRFDALTQAGAVALMRPGSDDEQDPNRLAMYPLVPWSNRIAKGGFEWQGHQYALAANLKGEPLPIHGDGWQRPWQVVSHQAQTLQLELCSEGQAPFTYHAQMQYRLVDNCFEAMLSVTHLGKHSAPYGLGFHPWFPRTSDTRITAQSEGVWDVDNAQLPTTWRKVSSKDAWNFNQGQALPEGLIDNLFTGWVGRARLEWPERRVALGIDTAPAMSRYLVFSPNAQADFFCFEPVSHDVDAHHFASPTAHGLVELGTGETLSITCRFTYHAADELKR